MIYIFDVDGTLTPSSKPIEKDFQNFFIEWASDKNFVLVSGSPYKKIERQLGKTIISMAQSVFSCSGLEQWQNFKPVWHYNYTFPSDLYILLENHLEKSSYPYKTGNHIDDRGSLINFSVVGRGSDKYRKDYFLWDLQNSERKRIVKDIESKFDVSVSIGGEISIDIVPPGWGKHKILAHLSGDDEYTFFGDRIEVDENDHSIYQELINRNPNRVYKTIGWDNTKELLKRI